MIDFKDSIKLLAERAKRKNELLNKEATKHALILPFIGALGYDVFNPSDVIPDIDCEALKKKGECIDYAICSNGEPVMLVECLYYGFELDDNKNLLRQYFPSSDARIAVLTNGLEYRFYSDLEEDNVMDNEPFFVFNIESIKDEDIDNLKQFCKPYFDTDALVDSATIMKYKRNLLAAICDLVENPSPDFVKLISKPIYGGNMTERVLDQFTTLVKSCFATYVNDIISDRLQRALKAQEESAARIRNEIEESEATNSYLVPSEEEMQALGLIKALLAEKIDTERITYVITQSYFAIVLDGTTKKTIARLNLRGRKKSISITTANEWARTSIENSTSSIIALKDELLAAVEAYNTKTTEQNNA